MIPKTTLEQWAVLKAIVDHGSYAQAAEAMNRSQSSISYMVTKLQEQLGVPLLSVEGRKARLTEAGQAMLLRATELLQDSERMERLAAHLVQGWEAEVRLAVDGAFPENVLVRALQKFAKDIPQTKVQLKDVVLSGADEVLLRHECELVIGTQVPIGYLGDFLCDVEFVAVAHPHHPLHQLGRDICIDDLAKEQHIVVRDSGTHKRRNDGWFSSVRRWSVSSLEKSRSLVIAGLGFAWLPMHLIQASIDQGLLCPLPMGKGQRRKVSLYLIHADPEIAGPAATQLAKILRDAVS